MTGRSTLALSLNIPNTPSTVPNGNTNFDDTSTLPEEYDHPQDQRADIVSSPSPKTEDSHTSRHFFTRSLNDLFQTDITRAMLPVPQLRPRTISHAHPSYSPNRPPPAIRTSESPERSVCPIQILDTPVSRSHPPPLRFQASPSPQPSMGRVLDLDRVDGCEVDKSSSAGKEDANEYSRPNHELEDLNAETCAGGAPGFEDKLVVGDLSRDPAILFAGARCGVKRTYMEIAKGRQQEPNEVDLVEPSALKSVLVKPKLAPEIKEGFRLKDTEKTTKQLLKNVENSRKAWEQSLCLHKLLCMDRKLVNDFDSQLAAGTFGKINHERSSSESADFRAFPSQQLIWILLDDPLTPSKKAEWPIYLKTISPAPSPDSPPLVWVDYPDGFPYPPVSSDGTLRLRVKSPEDCSLALWPDNTIRLICEIPGDSSVPSLKGHRQQSWASPSNREEASGKLDTLFKSRHRAESFPLSHSLNESSAMQSNFAEAEDGSRGTQHYTLSKPPHYKYPYVPLQRNNSKSPQSSLTNQYLPIASSHDSKRSQRLPTPAFTLATESRYKDAGTQIDTPVSPWKIPLPPSPEHLRIQKSIQTPVPNAVCLDRPALSVEVFSESQDFDAISDQQHLMVSEHLLGYRNILGTLNRASHGKPERPQRVWSDSLRILAETICSSPTEEISSSNEDVASQLKKASTSPDFNRRTIQRCLPRYVPKNKGCGDSGSNSYWDKSNWRQPSSQIKKKHRQDVRYVFSGIFKDRAATSTPDIIPTQNSQQNNENRRVLKFDRSISAEQHSFYEHVQTLREKGKVADLLKLKEALEKSLSEEKENLVPIRQPLQPVVGAKGFKDRASLKRPIDFGSHGKISPGNSRGIISSRGLRASRPRSDETDSTVVRRQERGSSERCSDETLIELGGDEYSYKSPDIIPISSGPPQVPIYSRPPISLGVEPVYIYNSTRGQDHSLPQPSYVHDAAHLEPVYYQDSCLRQLKLPYSHIEDVTFQFPTQNTYPQHLESADIVPPIVDGQSLPQPQFGNVEHAPFPYFHPEAYPQHSANFQLPSTNFFTPPMPQSKTWPSFDTRHQPVHPTNPHAISSSVLLDSGPHLLCHRLPKDEADKVLGDFVKKYPITGKNLFKESLAHQISLCKSKGKAKGKDAAAIQQSLEMILYQKRQKKNRELALGRKDGVEISVKIRKPGEEENE